MRTETSETTFSLPRTVPRVGLGRRDWAVALFVALVSLLVRLPTLEQRGIWYGEYRTMTTFEMSIPTMVRERIRMGHSPLYFLYARLGPKLGSETWQWRLPSAIMVPATVLLLTGLFGALGLRRYLPAMWGIAVLQPFWFWLAASIRYMMPLIAVGALTLWALARYIESPTDRRGVALALAGTLLSWMHMTAALIVVACVVFLAWESRAALGRWSARPVLRLAWPALAAFAAAVVLALFIRSHARREPGPVEARTFVDLLESVFGAPGLWPGILGISSIPFVVLQLALMIAAIFLARWELLRTGHARAWRLVLSLLIGIPGVFLLFCVLGRNFQGAVRYLAGFGLPAIVCLAVAWYAPMGRFWKWSFRGALVLVLATQALAVSMDPGDPHRDVAKWITIHHSGNEPVIVSPYPVNRVGLIHSGLPATNCIVTTPGLARMDKGPFDQNDIEGLAREIEEQLGSADRAWLVRYQGFTPVREAVRILQERGIVVGERNWEINSRLICVVIITRESERKWLENLPGPQVSKRRSLLE